jgi:predicted amidohydrolase
VKVALLQLDYPDEGPEGRVARVRDALAAAPGADLLVLPELWDVGYFAFDEYAAAARPVAESVGLVADAAVDRAAVLVAGSVLERDDDRIFNTVLVIGPDGSLLGRYRKSHLFGNGSRVGHVLRPAVPPALRRAAQGRRRHRRRPRRLAGGPGRALAGPDPGPGDRDADTGRRGERDRSVLRGRSRRPIRHR